MQQHTFRRRLEAGERLIGTIVTLSDPAVAEIMAQAGFDWLWFDAEHSPLNVSQVQVLAQAAGKCPCLVRVPALDEAWVKKTLDAGVEGIIFPLVTSAEQAARAAALTKYPPLGQRPVGLGRAQGYGYTFASYVQEANDWVACIIQIEHIHAVENLDAILQVEGIDALVIGPYDLSTSMGKPGQVDEPEVQSAIRQVKEACRARRKPLAIFSVSLEGARRALEEGFDFVVVGADSLLLANAAAGLVAGCREVIG